MDPGLVADTVRGLFQEIGLKTKDVITAVGGHDVIIKKIEMDRMKESDAREVIRWEAEQHLPFDIKGGLPFSLPRISAIPADPYILGAIATGVATVGLLGWWYLGLSSSQEEVQVALVEAVSDSANYADLIQRNEQLTARRDSIAQKVNIIQEIDAGRFIWPHVLDEIARALPDYTWLSQILQVTVGETIEFQIHGKAGNNFALTSFGEALEASPFIRNVALVQTEQVLEPTGQLVFVFQLDAAFEVPPMELLETVPLFGSNPLGSNR